MYQQILPIPYFPAVVYTQYLSLIHIYLLSIQIIAQKSSFVGSAMPDLSDIENAYKNYQSEKNNLVSNLDLFFESVKKH